MVMENGWASNVCRYDKWGRSAGKMFALDVSAVVGVGNFGMVIVVNKIELAYCWIGCDC